MYILSVILLFLFPLILCIILLLLFDRFYVIYYLIICCIIELYFYSLIQFTTIDCCLAFKWFN